LIDNAIKKVDAPLPSPSAPVIKEEGLRAWLPILGCTCAYIISLLISIAAIVNVAGFPTHVWISNKLTSFGAWMPTDVFSGESTREARAWIYLREWLLLLVVAFIAYGLCAYCIAHRLQTRNDARTRRGVYGIIVSVVLVCGVIYLLTPATIATDMFSYASYGRLIAVYFTNPYFVPPSAFPHDVIFQWLYWKNTMSIYGPVWMAACAFLALLGGSTQMAILTIFKVFAFFSHLLNIYLVYKGLKVLGRSEKTVAVGTLLYAWNPLVLAESALGGHNDVFMVTFLLLGLYWCAKAEREGTFLRPRGYIPPTIAFTLATLVKFSAAPSLAVLVLALFCATMRRDSKPGMFVWAPALRSAVLASATFLVIAVVLYGPFWIGHSLTEILQTFTAQPSAADSINSILSTFSNYNNAHALPAFLNIFKSHKGWSMLNILSMLAPVVIGVKYLWKHPDTKTIATIIIISFAGFLITAPWFFSWYLTWLVGLVPFLLPVNNNRFVRAVLLSSLTYSFVAFFSYYTTWVGWMKLQHAVPQLFWSVELNVFMVGVPLLVFFIVWRYWPANSNMLMWRISVALRLPIFRPPMKSVVSGSDTFQ
jgi:hypothetical protein